MGETDKKVEAIKGTSKVSAIRPFDFLDSEMYRQQPKKQRKPAPTPAKEKTARNEQGCKVDASGEHIDCSI